MIRRPTRALLIAASVAAAAGLSSCEEFEPNEAAATVNGHEISMDQLDELAEGNDDPAILRAALSAWIQVVAVSENPGELFSEEALAAERELIIPPLIESTQEATQEMYELGLDGSPLLCMAVIPLPEEVDPATVLRALRAGSPFADMVAELSVDPSLIETGGALIFEGQECLSVDQWNVELLDQLADEGVEVGEPAAITLSAGEVIVLLRPFDELNAASKSLIAQGPVSEALLELYRAAEVTVHESFGTWDPEQGSVVAPSSEE